MIHPTAIIYDNVEIGKNVYIGAYCIIGSPAEHKRYWNKPQKKVIIGNNAVIHGHVTIDAGTEKDTFIGADVWLMKGVHIGHDAEIMNGATLAPHVCIGGYAKVGQNVKMGMGSVLHPRTEIANNCVIGMNSTILKSSETWEGGIFAGSPISSVK